MPVRYTNQLKADYGLTATDFAVILAITSANFSACHDRVTGEYGATALAENVAHDLNHDEWLDDPTHPVWDICADACLAAEAA